MPLVIWKHKSIFKKVFIRVRSYGMEERGNVNFEILFSEKKTTIHEMDSGDILWLWVVSNIHHVIFFFFFFLRDLN